MIVYRQQNWNHSQKVVFRALCFRRWHSHDGPIMCTVGVTGTFLFLQYACKVMSFCCSPWQKATSTASWAHHAHPVGPHTPSWVLVPGEGHIIPQPLSLATQVSTELHVWKHMGPDVPVFCWCQCLTGFIMGWLLHNVTFLLPSTGKMHTLLITLQMRYEVLIPLTVKITVALFGESFCQHLQGASHPPTIMMNAVRLFLKCW